jgi:general stress protein 26
VKPHPHLDQPSAEEPAGLDAQANPVLIWIIAARLGRGIPCCGKGSRTMDPGIETFILDLLRQHNILTLATVREDGFPQATTVGYANDGLTIYVGCGADSQKARNVRRCANVSLTVDHDEEDWNRIQGLSMGATAEIVTDPAEIAHIGELMFAKYPQLQTMALPDPKDFAFLKITPKVVSVLDYTKGFGHTEQVAL